MRFAAEASKGQCPSAPFRVTGLIYSGPNRSH